MPEASEWWIDRSQTNSRSNWDFTLFIVKRDFRSNKHLIQNNGIAGHIPICPISTVLKSSLMKSSTFSLTSENHIHYRWIWTVIIPIRVAVLKFHNFHYSNSLNEILSDGTSQHLAVVIPLCCGVIMTLRWLICMRL